MPSFTVLEVKGQEPWSNDKGQFIGYVLSVRNPEGREHDAKINKKTTSAPPAVGEVIDANLQPSNNPAFPPLLKANFNQGGKGGDTWKPKDPATDRQIAMQASQKCAVTILELAASHGDYKPTTAGDVAAQVKTIAAALWKQVQDAGAAETGTVHGLPVVNEPERTGAPEPTTPSSEYQQSEPVADVPFEAA